VNVESIAAAVTSQKQAAVRSEVAVRVLKLASEQQKSVLALLEGAIETADQVQQAASGHAVDVRA
jgi:hypothetical protein